MRSVRSWKNLWISCAIAAITFGAFAPALRASFVSWDDEKNFLSNPHYRGLSLEQLRWMWTTFHLGHYVPLSWMTLGADYELWGMDARGYHLTNLLLHALGAIVVYFLARRLLRMAFRDTAGSTSQAIDAGAFVSALLFAVHPLRVESVAWVTERRDVLSGVFFFGSTLLYVRSCDDSLALKRRREYWLAVALFVCALLSKATSMTLPAVLALLSVYPLGRFGGAGSAGWRSAGARRVYVELLPFALLAAGAALLSIVALHPPAQLDVAQKIAVSAYGLAFYLGKTLLPIRLSPLYSMPLRVDPGHARFVVGYTVVLALAAAMWWGRRRFPGIVAALLAFIAVTLPMLGIVQNGPQIAADRYTYHAAPALAIIAGGAVVILWSRPVRQLASSATVAVIAVLSVLTWKQTAIWHDSLALWSRVLELDDDAPIAHSAYATLMLSAGRIDEATAHSERAVSLAPDYPEAHNNLGVALSRQGRYPDAVEQLQRALALEPKNDEAYNNLGVVTVLQGDVPHAIAYYRRSLELNPDNAGAEINLGNALVRLKQYAEAIPHYRQALIIRPDQSEAHLNWGVALAQQGALAEAVEHFRAALALDAGNSQARYYLERATELLAR